jgi:hypothetical protein
MSKWHRGTSELATLMLPSLNGQAISIATLSLVLSGITMRSRTWLSRKMKQSEE